MKINDKNTDIETALSKLHLSEPSSELKEKVMRSANLAWEKTPNGNGIFVKPFPTFKFLLKYAALIVFALVVLFAAEISNSFSIGSYGRHNADVPSTEENEKLENMSKELGIDLRIYAIIAEEKSKSRTFENMNSIRVLESEMDSEGITDFF